MKKVALLFSGQGSQYVGMGKILYEKYPEVRTSLPKLMIFWVLIWLGYVLKEIRKSLPELRMRNRLF